MSKKIELDKEKVIELFCYKNYTDKQIGKEFNCSENVIGRFRRANGIIRLYKDYNWLLQKREEGLNDTEIAKLIGCNPGTISKSFKKITGISKSKNSYTINDNAFSEYTPESSYWAGFILADGHIENYMGYGRNLPNYKLRIGLSLKDKNHLKKLAKFLGDENIQIKDKTVEVFNGTYYTSEIRISRKSICKDLIDVYEIPLTDKSTNEFISNKIPQECLPHFIRGYFDGDGSIHNKIKGQDSPGIAIVGSLEICKQLKDYFEYGYIYKESNNLYKYAIHSKQNILDFYNKLYKNSKENIRLDRKYEKFKTFSYKDKRYKCS